MVKENVERMTETRREEFAGKDFGFWRGDSWGRQKAMSDVLWKKKEERL